MSETKRGQKGRKIKEYAEKHPDLSCWEIARALDVSHQTVYNHIGPRGKKASANKEERILKYIRQNPGKPKTKLAEELGISYNTLKKYQKKLEEKS